MPHSCTPLVAALLFYGNTLRGWQAGIRESGRRRLGGLDEMRPSERARGGFVEEILHWIYLFYATHCK